MIITIMVCEVHLLLVLLHHLLLTPAFTSAAVNLDLCRVHTLLGGSLTLPMDNNKTLNRGDVLRWTHKNLVIFYQQNGLVRRGMPTDIDATGSLLLRNVKLFNAGVYKASVTNSRAEAVNGWSGRVCVLEKLPKPSLMLVCRQVDGLVAMLTCRVPDPTDVDFAWTQQGREIIGATRSQLSVSLEMLNDNNEFSCSVRNPISREQSEDVRVKCKLPPPPPNPPTLYCFKAGTVMAGVVGGSALILLLLIVTVILCSRRQKQAKPECQPDIPMDHSYTDLTGKERLTEYEVMQQFGVSPDPGLGPAPGPRPCPTVYGNDTLLSVAKDQQEERRTAEAGGTQQPSPVPKPRTKVPHTAEK